jgi:hypothetical protein
MKKISEYEAHAEECRTMAGQMKNPAHKQQLIDMAEAWEMLAKTRARQLKQGSAKRSLGVFARRSVP